MESYVYICEDTNEIFYNYKSYLNSEHWKLKKEEYLSLYKKECAICKKKRTLNLHHKTYDNVGNESLDDLVLLCNDCHNKIHSEEYNNDIIGDIRKNKKDHIIKNDKISNFYFDEEKILFLPCKVGRQCRNSKRKGVVNITGNELFLYMLFLKTKQELSTKDLLQLITDKLTNKSALNIKTTRIAINGLLEKGYLTMIKNGRNKTYKLKYIEIDRIKLFKVNSILINKVITNEITTEELKCYIRMRWLHNEEVLKGISKGNIFRISMDVLASSLNISQSRISLIVKKLYENSIIDRNKIPIESNSKFIFTYEYKLNY